MDRDKDLLIVSQQLRIEALETRVDELERALVGSFSTPIEWGLTEMETRVFGALTTRPLMTKEAIMVAVYDNIHRDRPSMKIVDVIVCKIRKKVARFGVEIETVWGQGYRLKPREQLESAA